MRFSVVGADKDTGNDVDVVLVAASRQIAEADACKRGILVSAIKVLPEAFDKDAIELVADEPAEQGGVDGAWAVNSPAANASIAKGKTSHGTITLSANSPSESGFTGEAGERAAGKAAEVGMEYHVVMNQALYLLETAVNKYLQDGWEPAGGLAVGISNNALQYFQAVVRKRR